MNRAKNGLAIGGSKKVCN